MLPQIPSVSSHRPQAVQSSGIPSDDPDKEKQEQEKREHFVKPLCKGRPCTLTLGDIFPNPDRSKQQLQQEFHYKTSTRYEPPKPQDSVKWRVSYPADHQYEYQKLEYDSYKAMAKLKCGFSLELLLLVLEAVIKLIERGLKENPVLWSTLLKNFCDKFNNDKGNPFCPTPQSLGFLQVGSLVGTLKALLANRDSSSVMTVGLMLPQLCSHILGATDPRLKMRLDRTHDQHIEHQHGHRPSDGESEYRVSGKVGFTGKKDPLLTGLDPLVETQTACQPLSVSDESSFFSRYLQDRGWPYVSGPSSQMLSCFSVLGCLNLDFDSKVGHEVLEILAAVFVALGMNSYGECVQTAALCQHECRRFTQQREQGITAATPFNAAVSALGNPPSLPR